LVLIIFFGWEKLRYAFFNQTVQTPSGRRPPFKIQFYLSREIFEQRFLEIIDDALDSEICAELRSAASCRQ
jgi:hypothetical protein